MDWMLLNPQCGGGLVTSASLLFLINNFQDGVLFPDLLSTFISDFLIISSYHVFKYAD